MGTTCLNYFSRLSLLSTLLVLAGFLSVEAAAPAPSEPDLRKQALALNEITGTDPLQGALNGMLAKPEQTKKLLAVALKMSKQKPQPFNRNASYVLAIAAENLKQIDISAAFYRIYALQSLKVYSERGVAAAYVGLIQMYTDNKRYADSEKVCKEFLELKGDDNIQRFKMLVLRRMVLAQAKQGKINDALRIIDNLIKVDPENWLTRHLKGGVLREAGKYEEAAKVYEDVIERIDKDENVKEKDKAEFVDEIRYTLSGVYIDLKKVDKAAEQLQTLLKKDENNPTYNNDLGFIWADNDMKLDEAEKLVRKAIEEEKKLRKKVGVPKSEDHDNAAYLDSLGWVLYKKKKYKEALEPLKEAIKQEEGQHLEIYDHLAEVYVGLGEKDKALEAWKKGLTCPPVSKRDEQRKIEVEKKIKQQTEK